MPSYTARELERDTGFDRRTIAYYVQEGLLPKVGRRGPRTRYPQLVRDRLLFIRQVREAEEAGEVSAVSLSDIRKVFERVPPALIAGVADGRIAVSPDLVAEPSTAFRAPGMRRRALEERWGEGERPIAPMATPKRRPSAAALGSPPMKKRNADEDLPNLIREEAVAWEESEPLLEREAGPFVQRESDPPPVFSQLPEAAADHSAAYRGASDLAESLLDLQEVARRRNLDSPRSSNTWTRIEISPEIVLSVRGITEEDEGLVERVRRAMMRWIGR